MERWFRRFKYEWMQEGGYLTLGLAMDDVRDYVMYYNFVRPHRYNQGLPPVLTKTTYWDNLARIASTSSCIATKLTDAEINILKFDGNSDEYRNTSEEKRR